MYQSYCFFFQIEGIIFVFNSSVIRSRKSTICSFMQLLKIKKLRICISELWKKEKIVVVVVIVVVFNDKGFMKLFESMEKIMGFF